MFGEGVVNCVNLIFGVFMVVFVVSGILYVKWLWFMVLFVLIWFLIGFVFIVIGVMINWGLF